MHDERDADEVMEVRRPGAGVPCTTDLHLTRHLARAEECKADLVLAAGDLLHFPSRLNAEAAGNAFKDAVMPVLAPRRETTTGAFQGDERGSGRRKFSKVPVPVTGKTPASPRTTWPGHLAAIDNSSRRVTREQAAGVEAAGGRRAAVLMMHIPVSLPTLREPARLKLGEVDLMNDPELAPAADRELGDDESTALLVDAMATAPNLLAVVCGHLHLGREDSSQPLLRAGRRPRLPRRLPPAAARAVVNRSAPPRKSPRPGDRRGAACRRPRSCPAEGISAGVVRRPALGSADNGD
ncbi:MAG: hypothetical protein U1F77_15455 [Kiritimatiellia bacterium]